MRASLARVRDLVDAGGAREVVNVLTVTVAHGGSDPEISKGSCDTDVRIVKALTTSTCSEKSSSCNDAPRVTRRRGHADEGQLQPRSGRRREAFRQCWSLFVSSARPD